MVHNQFSPNLRATSTATSATKPHGLGIIAGARLSPHGRCHEAPPPLPPNQPHLHCHGRPLPIADPTPCPPHTPPPRLLLFRRALLGGRPCRRQPRPRGRIQGLRRRAGLHLRGSSRRPPRPPHQARILPQLPLRYSTRPPVCLSGSMSPDSITSGLISEEKL